MTTYAEILKELDNLRAELEMARKEAENHIDIKVERTLPLTIDICDMQVGDRITIPMGEHVYTATAVDERNGDLYFLFDQLLGSRPIDSRDDFDGTFNDSELFAWLNSEFKEQLPEWIRSRLNHDVTLPTVTQIFGTSDEWAVDCDKQFECMKDIKNRICTFENDTRWYWLSTKGPSSTGFANVYSNGVAFYYDAVGARYVRPLLKVRKFKIECSDPKAAISKKEFVARMAAIQEKYSNDEEEAHIHMDHLLCEALDSLGYEEGTQMFKEQPKWYA